MDQTSTTIIASIFLFAIPLLLIIFIVLFFRSRSKAKRISAELETIKERFRPVVDVDIERAKVVGEIEALNKQFAEITASNVTLKQGQEKEIADLRAAYAEKKKIFDRLASEVAIFDERIAFAELGIYEPHFDYTDSEAFKKAIERNRSVQKTIVSNKDAVTCRTQWSLEGSASKGQTMVNRAINLTLRAFNNECEAAIANARWNNINAMEKRIQRAFDQINTMNKSMTIEISDRFLKLRLEELYLTHEYREKQKAEKEERAELARAAREEQKLQRDLEKAEEEEARFQKMLEKARADAEKSVGPKLDAFNEKIRMLEKDLAEAHSRVERAQAMAERTRSGYVYIISNVGSFGDDVVKIGLTRRLDPTDRVRELGDASVPFFFDTHAIIYSDDAPALERSLHNEFEKVRINTQNYRKEFFRASIDDVETAVKRLAPLAPFFRDIEAQEYRETLAKRNAMLTSNVVAKEFALPEAI